MNNTRRARLRDLADHADTLAMLDPLMGCNHADAAIRKLKTEIFRDFPNAPEKAEGDDWTDWVNDLTYAEPTTTPGDLL